MFIQLYDGVYSDPLRNLKSELTAEELDFLTKVAKVNRTSLDLEIQRLKVYFVDAIDLNYNEIVETTTAPIFEEYVFGSPIILN